jgi:death-on-curing protein
MEPEERDSPTWVATIVVMASQHEQLNEHGGLHGVRDRNALESALHRPQHRHTYDADADLADLAAAYAFGITTSHPFNDGNKRAAYITAAIFLDLNGCELAHTDEDIVRVMLAVAAGEMGEEDLAQWFRDSLQPATSS